MIGQHVAVTDVERLVGKEMSEELNEAQKKAAVDAVLAEEQKAIAAEEASQASYRFRRSHPDFITNAKNVALVKEHIEKNGKSWTLDALESAYTDLASVGLLELQEIPVEEEETPTPVVTATPFRTEPWGTLTKASIAAMPAKLYSRYMRRPEFSRQVNRVLRGESQYE